GRASARAGTEVGGRMWWGSRFSWRFSARQSSPRGLDPVVFRAGSKAQSQKLKVESAPLVFRFQLSTFDFQLQVQQSLGKFEDDRSRATIDPSHDVLGERNQRLLAGGGLHRQRPRGRRR